MDCPFSCINDTPVLPASQKPDAACSHDLSMYILRRLPPTDKNCLSSRVLALSASSRNWARSGATYAPFLAALSAVESLALSLGMCSISCSALAAKKCE